MRGEAWKGISWVFYFSIRDSVCMWCLFGWFVLYSSYRTWGHSSHYMSPFFPFSVWSVCLGILLFFFCFFGGGVGWIVGWFGFFVLFFYCRLNFLLSCRTEIAESRGETLLFRFLVQVRYSQGCMCWVCFTALCIPCGMIQNKTAV